MNETRVMPNVCPKCEGYARFYHEVNNENFGYVKCEKCGYKQKYMKSREEAIIDWNKKSLEWKKDQRIWDNYEEIAEVRKSNAQKFVIAAATRQGFRYINIREFYMRKCDSTWMPSRDGITIPLTTSLDKGESFIKPLMDMLKGLEAAGAHAETMELMNEEKAVWSVKKE